MAKSAIHTPHDTLFRAALGYPEVSREFLELYLPDYIQKDLDFSTIKYCETTFVDKRLSALTSDVLLQVNLAKKPAYVYFLIEHQSEVDKFMPLRLVQYMVNIWERHIKKLGKANALPLPVIFPMVFFTGGEDYNGPRTLGDLCIEPTQMQRILSGPFYLVNIDKIPESTLKSHLWAGTLSFIMRQYFRTHLREEFIKIVDNLSVIDHYKEGQYVVELLKYIVNIDEEHHHIEELFEIIQDKFSSNTDASYGIVGTKN